MELESLPSQQLEPWIDRGQLLEIPIVV